MKKQAWVETLDICMRLKTMFIVEGQVSDVQLVTDDMQGGGSVEIKSLEEFLNDYLVEAGYKTVVFYNRIDGFYNGFSEGAVDAFYEVSGSSASDNTMADATKAVRKAVKNQTEATAIVFDFASMLLSAPDRLPDKDLDNFTTLFLASHESNMAPGKDGAWLSNVFFLIVNRAADLPEWLYSNNPYAKLLTIPHSDTAARRRLLCYYAEETPDYVVLNETEREHRLKNLTAVSDGVSLLELYRLLESLPAGTRFQDYIEPIRLYRYGRKENPWSRLSQGELASLGNELGRDVIGQQQAIDAVVNVIKRSVCGLSGAQHSSGGRPKGVLFFAGPTGTGKTELAKSMARNLFGDESLLLRFDMSEYAHEHSDQRLLGSPPGYVGYQAGGELTNAVKAHPFSIVLFDEIEKAHPTIMDKFLQILDDGRLTDSKGETVYFSETVIIFTSNAGIYRTGPDGARQAVITLKNSYEEIETAVKNGLHEHFVTQMGRPETLNRIGNNIVVFDYIRPEHVPGILRKQLGSVLRALREDRRINLEIPEDGAAWRLLYDRAVQSLEFGGRGVGNTVEKYFVNPLSIALTDDDWVPDGTYRVDDIVETSSGVRLVTSTIK